MHTLTETQRKWLQRILDDTTYNSSYKNNLGKMLSSSTYDDYQQKIMNNVVSPQYLKYLKTGKIPYPIRN